MFYIFMHTKVEYVFGKAVKFKSGDLILLLADHVFWKI